APQRALANNEDATGPHWTSYPIGLPDNLRLADGPDPALTALRRRPVRLVQADRFHRLAGLPRETVLVQRAQDAVVRQNEPAPPSNNSLVLPLERHERPLRR